MAGLLTGCGSLTLQGVPLLAGPVWAAARYQVTVQLRTPLDLVPASPGRQVNKRSQL